MTRLNVLDAINIMVERILNMTTYEAEKLLSELSHDELKMVISRLANLTPDVFYYSEKFSKNISDMPEKELNSGVKLSTMGQALMFLGTSASKNLQVNDVMEVKFTSLQHSGIDLGDYKVTVERLK